MSHKPLLASGLWVYILSDAVLFASLFAAYAVLHSATVGGPGAAELFDVNFVLIETLVLLVSSFTCGLALLAARSGNRTFLAIALTETLILGGVFLGMELHEFGALIAEGAPPSLSAFLSSYFTLVGTHGLHVAAGMVWILALLGYLGLRGIDERFTTRLTAFALFWHFLDIVWICIFSLVYLFGSLSL